jgi:ligand-binding sensor domain-containing protein
MKTRNWDTFTKRDGLAHNTILSITVDGDLIWFGTSKGLSRYDKPTGGWTTFTQFHGPEDI